MTFSAPLHAHRHVPGVFVTDRPSQAFLSAPPVTEVLSSSRTRDLNLNRLRLETLGTPIAPPGGYFFFGSAFGVQAWVVEALIVVPSL